MHVFQSEKSLATSLGRLVSSLFSVYFILIPLSFDLDDTFARHILPLYPVILSIFQRSLFEREATA